MAIITFWSECQKEIGQTSTAIAVATQMALEHNYKILLISTYNNNELSGAYWKQDKQKKDMNAIFGGTKKINIDSGILGLSKAVKSGKLTPDMITNYTSIVFKNRLEVVDGYEGKEMGYKEVFNSYPEIILNASMYYDMVIVDLNRNIKNDLTEGILRNSTVIAYGLNQKMSTVNMFVESGRNGFLKGKKNIVPYLGRYDKFSKYNSKNLSRTLRIGRDMNNISYNTLFNDACDEGTVADLFVNLKTIKTSDDRNIAFINETRKLTDSIIYKLEELKLKS